MPQLKASGCESENKEGPFNIYQLGKIGTFKWEAQKSVLKLKNNNKRQKKK